MSGERTAAAATPTTDRRTTTAATTPPLLSVLKIERWSPIMCTTCVSSVDTRTYDWNPACCSRRSLKTLCGMLLVVWYDTCDYISSMCGAPRSALIEEALAARAGERFSPRRVVTYRIDVKPLKPRSEGTAARSLARPRPRPPPYSLPTEALAALTVDKLKASAV